MTEFELLQQIVILDLPPGGQPERCPQTGCWEGGGWLNPANGYRRCKIGSKSWLVHRLVFTLLRGSIPGGLPLDHLCRKRSCCNPDHLEPVPLKENILRGEGWAGKHARQTHCKHGHLLEDENLRRNVPQGHRGCRICKNDGERRRWRETQGKSEVEVRSCSRKLTPALAEEIRCRYDGSHGQQSTLAQELGFSSGLVHRVVRGKIGKRFLREDGSTRG